MGLTVNKMIAPMDAKRGRMLLDDILNGGNLGHYEKHHVWGHNLLRLYRDARLLRYSPAEALSEPDVQNMALFLENEEQEIIDIRRMALFSFYKEALFGDGA